jgi:TolA-binding protein
MSDDLLREATRALRATDEASELEARATRARIMAGLHQTRVRRRTRYAFLLPIAATFVAASAWGAASGKAALVWASIAHLTQRSAPESAATSARPGTHGVPHPPSAISAPITPSPVAVPEPAPEPVTSPEVRRGTPPSGLSATAVLPPSAPASSAPSSAEELADPTLTLYRIAHTTHFMAHDPARALAAWDAYLAAAPNGAFAPEAHYNRALSLIRLGRTSEAKSALEPFATGVYGSYRQAEARALLERLEP